MESLSIEQLNTRGLALTASQPKRAKQLFEAALQSNDSFNARTGKNDYHVVTSMLQLARLRTNDGDAAGAAALFQQAVALCYSFPTSVRQAFLPAIHSESAMLQLQGKQAGGGFKVTLDLMHKNVALNAALAKQSKVCLLYTSPSPRDRG